ncbi:MAG: NAD(P)/FAD-dependent oxidoreductase [Firmicutes bacterium]|nr:NAD(P)/FAD-dependent oxidoreductase [Bacillota bacterium]
MAEVDVTVVGAGVVGLAVARRLAAPGRSVWLLERHRRPGEECSSRNSQVIHSGLYYRPGSLKAWSCVEGNRRTYELCRRLGVPCRRTGKLVVASGEEELPALERLAENGEAVGVEGIRLLEAGEVRRVEPRVRARAALWVPSTGLLDAAALVAALAADARARGAELLLRTELAGAEPTPGGWRLTVREPDGQLFRYTSRLVVNAAGLEADRVAEMAGIDAEAAGYRLHPAKGDYFSVRPARAGLIARPVYPLPEAEMAGLGIHATPDLDGRLRLGPDLAWVGPEWRRHPDYRVDEGKRLAFWEAARRYLPDLEPDDLEPEMAGVRPKLQAPGEPPRDFVVRHEAERGLAGWVNLVGIESPGLTAAPALAERVAELLADLL